MKKRGRPSEARVLQLACVCALVALGLMTWSLLDPRPLPVIVAMSAGQLLGTLSLAAFLGVVLADVRRGWRAQADRTRPPDA